MLSTLITSIKTLLTTARAPAIPIPTPILLAGSLFRSGVSPMSIAANIITRQVEAGAPFGPNTDGSANISEKMEEIRIDEIMKALRLDGKIEIVIPPGTIVSTGVGSSPSGPVTVVSTNTTPIYGYGIIR